MSGGIAVGEVAIPPSSNHAPGAHHDRAYRHFVRLQCALSAAQGFFHPKLVHPKFVHPEFVGGSQWPAASGQLPENQFSVPGSQFSAESLGFETARPF